jgi:hypothetical protein
VTTLVLAYPEIRQLPQACGGRAVFELTKPFKLVMPIGQHGVFTFERDAGAITDFGSVPLPLWPIVNPLDPQLSVAFLVHDDLYGEDSGCTRAQADAMLRVVAAYYGASIYKQAKVYSVLRAFGWACYPSRGITRDDLTNSRDERD